MNFRIRISLVVTALSVAALACQALNLSGAPTSASPQGEVILRDDFSSPQWGTGTDADSAVEYVNGALNFNVFTEDFFVWSTPDTETYKDIHMEVKAINNNSDSTTAFGFICNKSGGDFYYLVMTPAGEYAIAKAKSGEMDLFLTNNDKWASSEWITVNAASYRLGADCGKGRLALYVDGREIASVRDSSYLEGQVALVVWSGSEPGMVNNISFDDFLMSKLP
jgi:hypothetical protein